MSVPLSVPDRDAALERLRRPEPRRRPLFRVDGWGAAAEVPVGTDDAASDGEAPAVIRRPRRSPPADPGAGGPVERLATWWRDAPVAARAVTGAAAAVAAVVLVVALPWLRRPVPPDQALPRAGSDPATQALSASPGATAGTASADVPTTMDVAGSGPSGGAASGPGGPVMVHVAGAVAAPGVVRLGADSRVVDAVAAAGGLRPDADADRVNLAARLTDGQRVVVPVIGQPVPAEVPVGVAAGSGTTGTGGEAAGAPAPSAPVDINTADAQQLDALPGVGPATATAILDHREQNGPFRSVDDLLDVRGIGEAKLDALRDLVVAGS